MKFACLKKLVLIALVMSSHIGTTRAGEVDSKELPSRVRSIFLAKCSECHGRGLSRPKAALYLNELGPLAANRDWVVPHEPEKSYLWSLIRADDMPAKGAKAGPLNAQEKETVRAWIAAGAPVPPTSASMPSESSHTVTVAPESNPPSLTQSILAWFGRFHLLVIHFPIALLMAAALAEAIAAFRGSWKPSPEVGYCVLLGTAGAAVSVLLGWFHADAGGFGNSSSNLLSLHRWLGTTTGLWALATVVLSERDRRHGRRSLPFRFALWAGALLVAVTAHFGGLMVHG